MSSRALRRLRQEKEADLLNDENDGSEESDDDDATGVGGGGKGGKNTAFLMMLEESSSEEDDDSDEGDDSDDGGGDSDDGDGDDNSDDGDDSSKNDNDQEKNARLEETPTTSSSPTKSKKGKSKAAQSARSAKSAPPPPEEEDLDAILSDMNIGTEVAHTPNMSNVSKSHHANGKLAGGVESSSLVPPFSPSFSLYPTLAPFYRAYERPSIRSLLLSTNYDVRDLDLDNAMRSLLGGVGNMDAQLQDNIDNNGGRQRGQRGQRGRNARGRNNNNPRRLAKKYLFSKPKPEWGKPPSYVGGGLGARELTAECLEEERNAWSTPWPYDLELTQMEELETMEREGESWYGCRERGSRRSSEKSGSRRSSAGSSVGAAGGGGGGGGGASVGGADAGARGKEVENANTSSSAEESMKSQEAPSKSTAESQTTTPSTASTRGIPAMPISSQKWYTLQMSDTYQEHNQVYQNMLSSPQHRHGHPQRAGLHDPNTLALFVADHPYFAETMLQLAMVLYYINDRGRGNDLLRRCMFLYETALPSSVLPNSDHANNANNNNANNANNASGNGVSTDEILMDIDRPPNAGLFATLFRIMQTSGMTGCYANALAVGRFLLSLDPLRDPMGVLLILDYYALAGRRRMSVGGGTGGTGEEEEVEMGAAFIVQLVESNFINIHYKDPLTDRHHWCPLIDLPNFAYSYALALYRLSINEQEHSSNDADGSQTPPTVPTLAERADEALEQALTKFPMALPKLLALNNVNTQDRSFRMDWPKILPYFNGDVMDVGDAGSGSGGNSDNVQCRVTKAAGEHVLRIFVQRCHKFWRGDDVLKWLYKCSENVVNKAQEEETAKATGNVVESDEAVVAGETESSIQEDVSTANASADTNPAQPISNTPSTSNTSDTSSKPKYLTSTYSPALARYAQCDPSEYEDAFRTFPPEAIALDPNIVAPAMALDPNRRGRFLRRDIQNVQNMRRAGGGGGAGGNMGREEMALMDQLRGLFGGNEAALQELEVLDPDSPLLQLYLQSLLPWAQVEGVRPPRR